MKQKSLFVPQILLAHTFHSALPKSIGKRLGYEVSGSIDVRVAAVRSRLDGEQVAIAPLTEIKGGVPAIEM